MTDAEQTIGPVDLDELRSIIHSATHHALPFAEQPMKPFTVQERAGMQVEIADFIIQNIGKANAVRRPNPSGDADVREKIVLELVEMHKLAIAVANAKRHDGIGSFGAEEDLCQAAVSLRLGNAMLNAAVEIERLALTGNASTDRASRVEELEAGLRRAYGVLSIYEDPEEVSAIEALLNKDGGAG